MRWIKVILAVTVNFYLSYLKQLEEQELFADMDFSLHFLHLYIIIYTVWRLLLGLHWEEYLLLLVYPIKETILISTFFCVYSWLLFNLKGVYQSVRWVSFYFLYPIWSGWVLYIYTTCKSINIIYKYFSSHCWLTMYYKRISKPKTSQIDLTPTRQQMFLRLLISREALISFMHVLFIMTDIPLYK